MTVLSAQTLVTTDRIRGAPVRSADGEKVGKIEELVIDRASGAVVYIILRSSGLFGLDEHQRAIRWSDVRQDAAHDGYAVPLTKAEVQALPDLDFAALDGWVARQSPKFL